MTVPRRPLLLLPVVTLAAVAGCGGGSSGGSGASGAPATDAASSAAPAAPSATTTGGSAAGPTITIESFAYGDPLTVAPGTRVAVTNTDSAPHTVSSDTKGAFDSGDLSHSQTLSFTAPTQPGTYRFHCEYHSRMHGTLVVTG